MKRRVEKKRTNKQLRRSLCWAKRQRGRHNWASTDLYATLPGLWPRRWREWLYAQPDYQRFVTRIVTAFTAAQDARARMEEDA